MFDGTITINGKKYALDFDNLHQAHIPMSMDLFCELLDQNLPAKFELSNNVLIYHPMSTENHDEINTNLLVEANLSFRDDNYYKICSDSLAVTYPNGNSYYLPDASVVIRKQIEYVKVGEKKEDKAISNAIAVLEILSDGTEKYDRNEKSTNYRKIPTLRQYTFISQHKIQVENFIKTASGEWKCTIYTSKNDSFALVEEKYKIKLESLYRNTDL